MASQGFQFTPKQIADEVMRSYRESGLIESLTLDRLDRRFDRFGSSAFLKTLKKNVHAAQESFYSREWEMAARKCEEARLDLQASAIADEIRKTPLCWLKSWKILWLSFQARSGWRLEAVEALRDIARIRDFSANWRKFVVYQEDAFLNPSLKITPIY